MDGLFFWILVVGLSTDLVEGYAYSIRIDEHERACFGHDLKEGSGEVYVDLQVRRERLKTLYVVALTTRFVDISLKSYNSHMEITNKSV